MFAKIRWRKAKFYLCSIVASMLATPGVADSNGMRVEQVKTAFVLNIARFVEWPSVANQPKPSSQLAICLQHANPMFESMLAISGETISERPITINPISHFNNLTTCQIVLIAESELTKFQAEVATELNQPILTILDMTESNQANSARSNILVTLVRKGARIGFEINLEKARGVNLRLSSELLKLATIVKEGG